MDTLEYFGVCVFMYGIKTHTLHNTLVALEQTIHLIGGVRRRPGTSVAPEESTMSCHPLRHFFKR